MSQAGRADDPLSLRPIAALREATRRTLRAWKDHVVFGAFVGILGTVLLAPAASWILLQALRAASGGSVVNFDIADFVLSFRGILVFALWSLLVGAGVVVSAAGHAYLAATATTGVRLRLASVLRHIAADIARVPGLGAVKIALLAALGLPLIGAVTTGLAGLLLLPFGRGDELRDIVPRGLPVPLWMVAAGMALLFFTFSWLYVRWSLAIPGLALEGLSLTEATRRSVRRVRGSFWKVAKAHLLHHVTIALLLALLVGLLRFVGRPILTAILTRSPEAGAAAIAGLLVVFYALSGTLVILGTARLVSLTVVHHLGLGGAIERTFLTDAGEAGRRARVGVVVLVAACAIAFGVATWLTVPRVRQELAQVAKHTTVTAHRGSSIEAPENTLAAVRAAIEAGADCAEIDIQQARGGTLVVIHDGNLKRLAGIDANVWEMDHDQLGRLDVGSHLSPAFAGERIPTLEQVIDLARDKIRLNIELKSYRHETDAFVPDVIALLRRKDFLDRCIVTSLELPLLYRVRQLETRIKVGAIVSARIGKVLDLAVDLYSVQPLIATSEFVRKAHAEGREVHVWTVNEAADMQRFADRGVDTLITDAPRLARQVLDARTATDGLRGAAKRLFGLD